MSNKTVYMYFVIFSSDKKFEEILLDSDFQKALNINQYKTVELRNVSQEKNGTIIGLFVSTQRKNIPPTHMPGNDEYSAIPLKEGEGLVYPNIMLYSPDTHTLYLESNRLGVSDKSINDYFNEHAKRLKLSNFHLELSPILKTEAYERIKNMQAINSIIFKVANPIQMLTNQAENGALEQFGALSRDMNATKTMEIKLTANELEGGGLNKTYILSIYNFFSKLVNKAAFNNRSNKLIIRGIIPSSDGNTMIEDTVDFLLDRLSGNFKLDEPVVASHPQFIDRKDGILNVYRDKEPLIRNLFGSFNSL